VSKQVIPGPITVQRQRHFETAGATALREATVIRTMLDDLNRAIQLLDGDIAAEEERTKVFDIFDPLYSMLARALVARRDNVNVTVAALAQRLRAITGVIPATLSEAA